MGERLLGKEKISTLFIKYTIPAIVAMVISGSQALIAGMILGQHEGANALATVNIVNPYIRLAMSFSFVIAFGALSIIGRNLGSGDKTVAQNTFKTAFIVITVFATSYGLIGYLNAENIAVWLGANDVLMDDVLIYLKTISLFVAFSPLMVLTGFADRIVGKPQLYLHATLIMLGVNTSLSILLIWYLNMGVRGAALATGIAMMSGFLVTVRPMLKKEHTINVFKGHFDMTTLGSMLYNGSSEGIGSAAGALAIYLFNLEFMSRIGPNGVAAFTTISFVVTFGNSIIFGIADGMSPIISYNYGHEKYDRVRSIMKIGLISGMVVGLSICAILLFGGESLAGMFADSKEVLAIASAGAKIYALAFLTNSFNIIYSVYFTAIGGAKESAAIAFSRGILWIVVGINLWPLFFGITGVWLTVPVAELMTLLLLFYLQKVSPAEKVMAVIQTN
ncbi:MATE family efflux transporter [Acidaminobacter sp. JC074]|uniref:MATE family efflux transporter n=1 Tax=Acidaminobacter sp. JC074 TaxID=2530199 RepID=UPI001F0D426C|nr:MATE family efflux transporter [Acidaminobacter sp. JC074]MCH4891159.1 MATE family efflux transporter [Acidaminobacter sp. JC074]